jgi:CheY-like chemotaxis protein
MGILHLPEKMGRQGTLAINGREAIELLQPNFFDLVLMDIHMPVMGGDEATQRIREAERETGGHIRIIAVTAHALTGDTENTYQPEWIGTFPSPRSLLLHAEIDRLAKAAFSSEGATNE